MDVEVRPLVASEFARLCADMTERTRGSHWSSLTRQTNGELLYLIAWAGVRAVGQVSLIWRPTNDPLAAQLGCPWIVDLLTHSAWRSRGVGTALLRACEEAARARGATRIGLGVATTNHRARALYERLGYSDSGLGQQWMTGSWEDEGGSTHVWEELVTYLIKPLRHASA